MIWQTAYILRGDFTNDYDVYELRLRRLPRRRRRRRRRNAFYLLRGKSMRGKKFTTVGHRHIGDLLPHRHTNTHSPCAQCVVHATRL